MSHFIKKFLNKLFIQRDFHFYVSKWELIWVLLYLGKTSFDLKTRLRRTVEWNSLYCKLKVTFKFQCRLNTLFCFTDSLEKKILSGKIYYYVVNARLLITEKPSVTFTPEWRNTWGSLILQENALKTLSSLQYVTIYWNVIAR